MHVLVSFCFVVEEEEGMEGKGVKAVSMLVLSNDDKEDDDKEGDDIKDDDKEDILEP